MPTTLGFKDIIDLPEWRPSANSIVVGGAGTSCTFDPRERARSPYIYHLGSATGFYAYHVMNDEWTQLGSPALAGTFGAGSTSVFHAAGPSGNIAAGSTTTKVVLSTALPAAVVANQLANRGDGKGFVVRVINKVTGRTENRRVVANTAGTTPTITLDSALATAPNLNDTYEFQSGRVFMLGAGTTAAGIWKYYDILTNSFSGNLVTTNLPATIGTDSCMVALAEDFTPHNRAGTEGFFNVITSTGAAAGSITGATTNFDAAVLANEYRNFQIRITEDLTTPAAVGQRRRITSHTAGPSAVYTLASNWTTTPSTGAKFVIENDDDKILLWTSASATTFNYNITANTWDTTTWAARGVAVGAGCTANQAYGIVPDADKNGRHSYIFSVRGGASAAIDVFDIAGAATGSWTSDPAYGMKGITFTTGTCSAYDSNTNAGRYMYINQSGTQRMYRFDMLNRVLEPWRFMPYTQGTAAVSNRLAMAMFTDNGDDPAAVKLSYLTYIRMAGSEVHQCALQR